jgi:L-fuconolactonase
MRIDAHQHFWHYDPDRDAWITAEMARIRADFLPGDLEPLLTAHGFDGSVAVQAAQSEAETRFLLRLADDHPSILGVVGWVDLLAPDLDRTLEGFCRHGRFRGVRHIAQGEADDFLAREDVVRGIGVLGEFGLTYDILVYPPQLPAALSLVKALPDQAFVVDHMAKPRIADGVVEPWATQMRELARHPNVWCKISGLVTEADWGAWTPYDFAPYLEVVIDAFGPGRLMFGSDWPVCLVAAEYDQVVALVDDFLRPLPGRARAGVLGGNAAAFYGLPD